MSESERTKRAQSFFMQQFVGFEVPVEPKVQEIYAKAMILCAKGDGVLHPAERAWIQGYFSASGAPDEVVALVDTWDADEGILDVLAADPRTAKMAARNLVFDAFRVCEADGDLADGERERIYAMGSKMGLDERTTRAVEAAYEVHRSALRNKMHVLFPDGAPYQGN